ncbi:MAG: serine/threonine-protein kinase [Betaproteobacteria bacterium]
MSLEARFQLREKLGEGATSEVYDAYDRNLRRHVAIKLFKKFDRGGEFATLKERFLVDARAAAGVSHSNIVTIYDAGSFGDGIAIVMELVRDSLRKMLDRTPQLPLETIVAIAVQVADGLKCLHANGIFHRDIKPSNILLAPGNLAKIGDFGLAHLPMSDLTHTGTVIGTPRYMSPEQAQGQILDFRTDIFSLGVVLFEMLTGQTPFERPPCKDHVLLSRIVTEPALKPSQFNPKVPAELDTIVAWALAKAPQGRYQSAAKFADALRSLKAPA